MCMLFTFVKQEEPYSCVYWFSRLQESFWFVNIDMVKAFDVYENHTSLREIWFFGEGEEMSE